MSKPWRLSEFGTTQLRSSPLLGCSPPQPLDLSKAVARWQRERQGRVKTAPIKVLKSFDYE
jgi:hypothetical protein